MSEANNTGYVTIDELADYLKVKISTIRTWIKLGKLPADAYLKVSNTYRFNIDEAIAGLKRSSMADMAAEAVAVKTPPPLQERVKEVLVKARAAKAATPAKEKSEEVRLGGQSFTLTMEDSDIVQLIGGTR
jgi:excisionase family DNA binding protein